MSLEFKVWWVESGLSKVAPDPDNNQIDRLTKCVSEFAWDAGWDSALQHATDKLNEEAPDASAQDTTNASIEE